MKRAGIYVRVSVDRSGASESPQRQRKDAGFRGIECTIETADGSRIFGISAGVLAAESNVAA